MRILQNKHRCSRHWNNFPILGSMKFLLRFFVGLLLIFGIITLLLYVYNFEYILKGIQTTYLSGYTTAYIDDFTEFDNRVIEAGNAPQPWPQHPNYNQLQETEELEQLHEELETIAFLIIQNDSILFEKYAKNYGPDSRTNSFSMAKSVVAALLGKAMADGHIQGLEQPVADFFPQFDKRLTVGDLASMASGLNWDEDYYSPFSMTARAYFDDNLREQILQLEVVDPPGEEYEYLSGNTQLLAMVLEKATGQTLSSYLSESFWKPMGMESDALWQLDSEESGMEKAYCCIASNARDFARFGKLYKDHGKWNGRQLLDSAYVARSIKPRFKEAPQYGYGFWLENFNGKKVFYMRGILGQFVITVPEDNLIIVRLGHQVGNRPDGQEHSDDFYKYLEEVYEMLETQ